MDIPFFQKRKTIHKKKVNSITEPKKKLTPNKQPVGNPGKRSTKEATAHIMSIVVHMLANFETRADIIEVIGEKYGIGHKMVDVYIKKAREKLAESLAGDVDRHIQKSVYRLKDIKRNAAKSNNLNIILGCEKEINKILIPRHHIISGMGKDGKIEHEHEVELKLGKDKKRAAEVLRLLSECGGNT